MRQRSDIRGVSTLTLRRVWVGTVVKLLAIMVGVAVVAVGAAQYQRSAMHEATARMESTMSAQVALGNALLGVNDPPAIGMMYGTGNTVPPAELRAGYELTRSAVNAAFDTAEQVMVDPGVSRILIRAKQIWHRLDAAVLAAPDLVASGVLEQDLAKGIDPYKATVWADDRAITIALSDLGTENVRVLQRRSAEQGRTQLLIVPLVLGSLAAALLLSWFAARRMKRDVLAPILELRSAALALRESRLNYVIDLNGGTVELRDLATTLNDAAVTLGATHRVLRDQALTDALTGLPNRKASTEHLVAKLTEPGAHQIGVLFIDLDDFKDINDTLGHEAGDELLSIVGRRLRSATRAKDFVARLGGDEFAIIVDCGDVPGEAVNVAERVVAALNEPVKICDTTSTVRCSIGIATSSAGADASAADELLRNADFAMYMAKSQGKNGFDVFVPSMHSEMLARIELKRDLAEAVRLDQLVLYYQPIIDLSSGALRGFEALIRWQHPIQGLLSPSEFIALAENTGDIIEIGTWVLDRACRDLAVLRRGVPDGSMLHVAINVSAHQITTPTFVDVVKNTLARHALPAQAVTLEITEAVALTNTRLATLALEELRSHGLRIALDDFGIGYSSLRSLHELPIDIIKIDRSFRTDQGSERDLMLDAIVKLGQSLGLEVIAEGIETSSELERLHRFDALSGQGSLFARPMPATDAALFAQRNATVAENAQLCAATPVPSVS